MDAPASAPIREACHKETLCRDCTRILQDCRHVHKLFIEVDGFKVVTDCAGYTKVSTTQDTPQ